MTELADSSSLMKEMNEKNSSKNDQSSFMGVLDDEEQDEKGNRTNNSTNLQDGNSDEKPKSRANSNIRIKMKSKE